MAMWVMFTVPCPTPSGLTADDLLQKRLDLITPEMKASAKRLGCRFHRAWVSRDRDQFVAVACWESADGANAFFDEWDIDDEEGEVAIRLDGDIGLVVEGEWSPDSV
jgi:hypothetical protein